MESMKLRRWISRMALVSMLSIALVGLSSGVAAAADSPAPGTGLIGACNMVINYDAGMKHAMTVNNPHGDRGMWHAVDVSGCS